MNIVYSILKSLASIISIYSTLCFIRIILTWIPSLRYSRVTQFFSEICDPYLNLFSKIRFLHIGMLDFSPILAFALLSAVSQILIQICNTGRFSFAYILAVFINFAWEIFASILVLLIIVIVIRLITLLSHRDSTSFWSQIDSVIFKIARPITNLFGKNRYVSLKTMVIVALIETLVIYTGGKVGIYYLCRLCLRIPF